MDEEIQHAVEVLSAGGVIVYPTETAYGLGCDARNESAVTRVFDIKKRLRGKSVPVIVADLEMAREYGELGVLGEQLAARFWPGPLTLIVKCKKAMPAGVVSEDGGIALRVSSHSIAHELSVSLGGPIVATSANLSDQGNKYSIQEVKDELGDVVDYYFDVGEIPHVMVSTIVDVRGDKPAVIRLGGIKLE